MWPNEQINGISFCGALMNGENRAGFFTWRGGGIAHARVRPHTHASNNPDHASVSPGWTGINAFSEYR